MISEILKQNKRPLALVIGCILVENVSWIIEPTFFGNLLDALIDDFYKHQHENYVIPLIIWIAIYLLNVLGGAGSRWFSGSVFSRIYANIATEVVLHSKKKRHSISTTVARAELAKEYIVFLKERIPEILWQVIATVGGIIALALYDWRIAAICMVVVLPMIWINRIYQRRVAGYQKDLHDTREEMFNVISSKDQPRIREYFHSMVGPQISIAKWNSFDYGVVRVLLMVVFVVVLFFCVDVDKFSTGNIYSIVSYLWTFIASTEYLPGLMESMTSVKDLNNRMKEEVEAVVES
jgi:ABC-type multidrug transport system fused ATPase/permease subunit